MAEGREAIRHRAELIAPRRAARRRKPAGRRLFLLLGCALGVLAGAAPATAAEPYPSRPIRLIVPFAPGGGTDMIARVIAQKLNQSWGQPVVVDNRAGGGGNIGTAMVARSAPDGYTVLMGYVGNLAINPSLYKTLPYDPVRDFTPVSLAATAPNVLVAHPSVPARTVKELVALARSAPDRLNYASAGNGTVGHMVAELFRTSTGAGMLHVPYKGNGAAIADVLAGNVQLMFSAPASVIQHVKARRLHGLATTSPRRLPGLEDVPTFAEAGYPSIDASAWYGLLLPAGAPAPVVSRFHGQVARILGSDDVKARFASQGYDATPSTPSEFARLIRNDLAKWAKVVKASGATVD